MNDDIETQKRKLKNSLRLGFMSDGIELSEEELEQAVKDIDFSKPRNMVAIHDRAVARAANENRDVIEVLKEEMAAARRAGELPS